MNVNKNSFLKVKYLFLFVLPSLVGCGGGGAALAAIFGSVGGAAASSAVIGGGDVLLASAGSGAAIGTFHNPEPASMALVGVGMVVMAFQRRFKK